MRAAEPAPTGQAPAGVGARDRLHLVVTGHVDHGKSTVIGRLLADTHSLPDGKLESVRAACQRTARPFEYAFLVDALKDERAQGITIDAARVFFRTPRRHYIIIDAPGHVEFLRNMVTGASRAGAAVLVIDAADGVQENSRRHGYLLALLGIRQILVLVNKMDLVGFQQAVFERIADEYREFLGRVGIEPAGFLPVSGFRGDNIAARSDATPWYGGATLLEALDAFAGDAPAVQRPFRMAVQDVYKFTGQGDDRRIVAGSIEAGRVRAGDEIVFYPSGKRTRVRSIEAFNAAPPAEAIAPHAAGFTLAEQLFVTRGELVARVDEPPPFVGTRLRASIFWLGRTPLAPRKDYILKLGTARVTARVESIERVVDASDLSSSPSAARVERHEVADCVLVLSRPIAFDCAEECAGTGRFVLVDDYEISGGGIVRGGLPDGQSWVRDKVLRRNLKWSPGGVLEERRAERFGQRPALLIITGERDADRKRLGRELEVRLFEDGRIVYFLAMGNVLYGVDADLERTSENRGEHLRRLSEVVNILLDAGMIVIATAVALAESEVDIMRTALGRERVSAVWVGDRVTTDLAADLALTGEEAAVDGVGRLKSFLQDAGVIFKPW